MIDEAQKKQVKRGKWNFKAKKYKVVSFEIPFQRKFKD
jgi:hypothetical protein